MRPPGATVRAVSAHRGAGRPRSRPSASCCRCATRRTYVLRAVAAARAALGALGGGGHQIVIVDDAPPTGRRDRRRKPRRGGPARSPAALRGGAGWARASGADTPPLRGTSCCTRDADLPFDFQELPRAVRLLRVPAGGRPFGLSLRPHVRGRRAHPLHPRLQRPRAGLFALRLRDVNFSFKLFRRSLLERIQLQSEGSFIDAEFLVRARKAGASDHPDRRRLLPPVAGTSRPSPLPAVILGHPRGRCGAWRELRGLWRGSVARGRAAVDNQEPASC